METILEKTKEKILMKCNEVTFTIALGVYKYFIAACCKNLDANTTAYFNTRTDIIGAENFFMYARKDEINDNSISILLNKYINFIFARYNSVLELAR